MLRRRLKGVASTSERQVYKAPIRNRYDVFDEQSGQSFQDCWVAGESRVLSVVVPVQEPRAWPSDVLAVARVWGAQHQDAVQATPVGEQDAESAPRHMACDVCCADAEPPEQRASVPEPVQAEVYA